MLKRLAVYQKLLIMLIAPLTGLIFFAAVGISAKLAAQHEMNDVKMIAGLMTQATGLLHNLQKERGYSSGYLASQGAQFAAELRQQTGEVDLALGKFMTGLQAMPAEMQADLQRSIAPAKSGLGALAATRGRVESKSMTSTEAIRFYTALNDALLKLEEDLLDMVNDIEARNQLGALVALSNQKENMGVERAVLAAAFDTDKFTTEQFRTFLTALSIQEVHQKSFEFMASQEQRDFYREKVVGASIEDVSRMQAVALEKALQGGMKQDPSAWFKAATAKIDLLRAVEEKMTTDVIRLADGAQAKATETLTLFAILASLAMAIALILSFVVGRSITRPLTAAQAAAQEISSQIVAAIQQQSATSTETASAVSQTTSTVDEIRRTSEMAVQKANAVVEVADRGAAVAKEGTRAIAQGIEAMLRIRTEVEGIARNILDLSEKNLQIGDIVQSVNALAEQSNLLAVNASIEAAKAGEQGKGFAVVAGEVKALAEQSKEATAQIRKMLADIQKSSNAAVMVTEQGTKRVEEGSRLIEELGRTIEAIASVNNENADAARQITAAASQQMVGIEQITGAMRNIEQATRDNAAGIQQLERSAHHLKTVSNQVADVVNGSAA